MSDSSPPPLPVVLELAPLPREHAGPFLILGVPKTATDEDVEANWAKRLIWARKKQVGVPLEDINWAKDALLDVDKRLASDAASLNLDTGKGVLEELAEKYSQLDPSATCRPIDVEKELFDYSPDVEIPNEEELRAAIEIPEIPREYPIVEHLLREFAAAPLDAWDIQEPTDEEDAR